MPRSTGNRAADSDAAASLGLPALRRQVDSWFAPASLRSLLGPSRGPAEDVARRWLAGDGKRWRPILAAGAFLAIRGRPAPPPADLRRIAVAVECFHKASLIHDDIEDGDSFRYGRKTLHEEYGVPVALNAGDLLLGEGYRLISESDAAAARKAEMLRVAAAGHRRLCDGQGRELCWMRRPQPLAPRQVIDIFREKTVPAFEVAIRLGAILAGAGEAGKSALSRYSEALGITYQIADDLADSAPANGDGRAMKPSLLLAIAHERAADHRGDIESYLERKRATTAQAGRIRRLMSDPAVQSETRRLLVRYSGQALRSLAALPCRPLKDFLRQVLERMFEG